MTDYERMAEKYRNTPFSFIYQYPKPGAELTPEQIATEAQRQRNREAAAAQRQKTKEKNARFKAKLMTSKPASPIFCKSQQT